ncbi:MAG: YggS family pyridoxal phosphate-dependent enzyme [Candidatus Sericytochromatia bacterium]|nr:YggS family pyridoxal phosphate-dependent enzyme [Candidatus Sericytochromatia bacterium]
MEKLGLNERYHSLLGRVAEAARQAGRDPDTVRIVAVTKYAHQDEARALLDCGIRDLGESKVQAALSRRAALSEYHPRWHLIGHLQTNKVNKVVGAFALIHSVDSWRLAEALNTASVARGVVQPVLFQVNSAADPGKFGLNPVEVRAVVERAFHELPGLRVCGLMTMAPQAATSEIVRSCFRRVRMLLSEVAARNEEQIQFKELSMGMSQDFPEAIAEGATMIRIGSAIFGGGAATAD